ncbi:MAG: S9 family peptidase, partial [Flavobacteriaceae bacterium]|nr:S9 family peptidase [Flavobacteriaceae bacterium]
MNKLVDFLKYNNYKVSIERKSFLLIIIFSLFIISCNYNSSLDYHITKKIPVVDTYFETEIIDNYRWLEDDMSSETEDWVSKQNELTYDYLNKIPFRDELKTRLSDLWNYEKISAPFKEGEYTYFYKNSGLQNQMVLYRQLGDNNPEVFLDPNTFSIDGTTSLAGTSFSKDGSLLAYSISEGGSDWRKIIVVNVESNQIIEDTLVDVKFSGISWKSNDGFYYS